MKKRLVPIISIILLAACNQTAKTREVPTNISEAFAELHPNATILKWNDEPPIWEAKYTDGAETGAVSFNADAQVTESELVIPENQLPDSSAIPDYIKTHYPNEKIQGCEKITKADGTVTYEIQITGKELVFTSDAQFKTEEPD